MPGTADSAARQMARLVVMYDTPSDVDAFERHYNDVHVPLAKRYPGLRRYTCSHEPTEALRGLKGRLSDIVYHALVADGTSVLSQAA
ncbi:MAG TPA: EthD family reductase [Mycobacterium sp.]|nr:EthD family reductase [Mycobacterium sp.]